MSTANILSSIVFFCTKTASKTHRQPGKVHGSE